MPNSQKGNILSGCNGSKGFAPIILIIVLFFSVILILFFKSSFLPKDINQSTNKTASISNQDVNYYYAKKEGDVYSEKESRYYPVFNVYRVSKNSKDKVFSVGKEGEYVRDMILIKGKKLIIINPENKLTIYDLNSNKAQYVSFTNNETIGNIVASPDENFVVFNLTKMFDMRYPNPEQSYKIIVLDLNNFTQEIVYKEVFSENSGYITISPVDWFDKDNILLVETLHEGPGKYRILSLPGKNIQNIDFLRGIYTKVGSKIVNAKELPPYGGCYFADNFSATLYDLKDQLSTNLFNQDNTILNIIEWSPTGNEFLYTSQQYKPDVKCGDGKLSETESFVYYLKTKENKKVNSVEAQLFSWYPEKTTLYKNLGIDLNKRGFNDERIIFLGK